MDKKEYIFSNEIGDAILTVYQVFPGVQLVYNSVHMDHFDLGDTTKGNLIEIHHCQEGRIEQEFDNQFFYLMPGDLSIAIRDKAVNTYIFPLNHYHGITIAIDTKRATKSLSELLGDVNVRPLTVAKRLCEDKNCCILRSETFIDHIFAELYSIPEHIKKGYLKVKILELLLILSEVDPLQSKVPEQVFSESQVIVAKQVAEYLSQNMYQHITIANLAKKFNVSDTYLKNSFKNVYGVPIFSYIRIQKMQLAAQLLVHTDTSIMEIASRFGYNNGSKFTAAFKKIMGESPSEYRKIYKMI